MMAIYINGAGVAAEDGMRRHYNEPLDIRPEIAYRVVDCDCGYGNPDGASFCSRCGSPLTDEARAKISERARAADARHTQETERLARLEADLTDVRGFLTNLGMQTGLERTLVEAKNQPPELVTLPDSAGGMRLTAMTVKRYGPSDALPAKVAKVLEKLEKRAKKGKEAKA